MSEIKERNASEFRDSLEIKFESNDLSSAWSKTINNGQFGINPNELKVGCLKRRIPARLSEMDSDKIAVRISAANKEKKSLKRLSSNSRFAVESFSKKHNECKFNKNLILKF